MSLRMTEYELTAEADECIADNAKPFVELTYTALEGSVALPLSGKTTPAQWSGSSYLAPLVPPVPT
ncbi:MAG: hypothetical protein IJQ65_05615, partial [Kiritimatiellae bacterium]|nr:hypothetical protein [Kiritimatiellia bacterium]